MQRNCYWLSDVTDTVLQKLAAEVAATGQCIAAAAASPATGPLCGLALLQEATKAKDWCSVGTFAQWGAPAFDLHHLYQAPAELAPILDTTCQFPV